jgi:hypothetical protein
MSAIPKCPREPLGFRLTRKRLVEFFEIEIRPAVTETIGKQPAFPCAIGDGTMHLKSFPRTRRREIPIPRRAGLFSLTSLWSYASLERGLAVCCRCNSAISNSFGQECRQVLPSIQVPFPDARGLNFSAKTAIAKHVFRYANHPRRLGFVVGKTAVIGEVSDASNHLRGDFFDHRAHIGSGKFDLHDCVTLGLERGLG